MCASGGGGGVSTTGATSATSYGVPTPKEIVEQLGENIETLDNPWEDFKDNLQESADSLQESGEAIEDTSQNILNTIDSTLETGFGVSEELSKNLVNMINPQKPIASDDEMNAMASLEGDPRLASLRARMRNRRKEGKSQLRKGGGLYIPLKAGIQVQT